MAIVSVKRKPQKIGSYKSIKSLEKGDKIYFYYWGIKTQAYLDLSGIIKDPHSVNDIIVILCHGNVYNIDLDEIGEYIVDGGIDESKMVVVGRRTTRIYSTEPIVNWKAEIDEINKKWR